VGRRRERWLSVPAPGSGLSSSTRRGSASRGERRLFEGRLLVRRGDRIGVVGSSGAGQRLATRGPRRFRRPRRPPSRTNLEDAYFDQHLGTLDASRTAVEEIRSIRGDPTSTARGNISRAFVSARSSA
jgi:ATP-binding cassette subfamily F protein 3